MKKAKLKTYISYAIIIISLFMNVFMGVKYHNLDKNKQSNTEALLVQINRTISDIDSVLEKFVSGENRTEEALDGAAIAFYTLRALIESSPDLYCPFVSFNFIGSTLISWTSLSAIETIPIFKDNIISDNELLYITQLWNGINKMKNEASLSVDEFNQSYIEFTVIWGDTTDNDSVYRLLTNTDE